MSGGDESEEGEDVGLGTCVKETAKALLIMLTHPQDDMRWVPKSQVSPSSEVRRRGDSGVVIIAAWIARKNGWGRSRDASKDKERDES